MNYQVEGNTIYAQAQGGLGKSLTIDFELPEGYFIGGSNNYGNASKVISMIVIIGSVAMLLMWYKYGKDNDKVPQTVEFYPPKGMDAAEVGYIYGKQTGKKLTIALVVGLASKGYVKIEESEDKKTTRIKNMLIQNNTKNLQPLTKTEQIVYSALFWPGEASANLSTNTSFYRTFDEVSLTLEEKSKDLVDDSKSRTIRTASIAWTVISMAFCLLSFYGFADLSPQMSFLYTLSFIAEGVTIFLTLIMGRKTIYGEYITSKIMGFREYLELAEKEQLEALVNENPNYFYEILLYAYVLNVSNKWISKFENIPMPENYMGNYDYRDISTYDRIYDSVYYPVHTSSGSSGCSSCGGGCSSCGGGCSSCGGGGSW